MSAVEPVGISQTLIIITALTNFLLAAGGAFMYFRWQQQRKVCDRLLQEKEVIFGFVHDVGEVFAESESLEADLLLKRVLYYALRTTRAAAGAMYLMDDRGEALQARAITGIFPPLVHDINGSLDHSISKSKHVENLVRTRMIQKGEGLIGAVADLGTPILIPDAECDPRVPRHHLDFLRVRSVLLVPMRFHQHVMGVLVVVNRVDGLGFVETDLNLLQALADQASAAVYYAGLRESLDEKKRIDHDLSLARDIQSSLLPSELPKFPGVEIAAFNQPAKEIGGDYYDVIPIDDRHIGLAIADVSGKSIGGAMLMSVVRSVLRAQATGFTSPAELLRSINRVMSRDISEDMFVTMLYMVLDLETRRLVVARAGHEKPLVIRANRTVEFIESPGTAIGLMDPEIFDGMIQEVAVTLMPGDVVVGYTDGVTEAMNAGKEEWGMEAFIEACVTVAPEGAHSLLNQVRQRVSRFVGDHAQYDDMTLLAMRVSEYYKEDRP
ncbi:MAG TPA: SpoIIE family protein phosphatase [Kiritimatiellia bacterium]|nr:SpoIIE family protein phosphatase [Kiritimatiellia bacterium]HMP00098.1 SpoIIE family protein phosphatase [Kiritimatiellia bacterium]HMP96639.1 SpoIIE family protein phosphatase [Kiritimatiellia bacterium]